MSETQLLGPARSGRATAGVLPGAVAARRAAEPGGIRRAVPRAGRRDPRAVPGRGRDGAAQARRRGGHRPSGAAVSRPESAARPVPPHPERLGDYRILRVIGEGGMGVVYEAEHESLKSRVALKVMHPRFRADRIYLRRFQTEARSAARLHHTNIVPVFDFGEQDGICYYAMQYIAGVGLHDVLDDVRRLRAAADGASQAGTGGKGDNQTDRVGRWSGLGRRPRPADRSVRDRPGHSRRIGTGADHFPFARRPGQRLGDRLRPGQAHRGRGPLAVARPGRDAAVHGSRAVPGRHRPPRRHLCPGRGALRFEPSPPGLEPGGGPRLRGEPHILGCRQPGWSLAGGRRLVFLRDPGLGPAPAPARAHLETDASPWCRCPSPPDSAPTAAG